MVLTELLRLKEPKSSGPDEIPAKILKELADAEFLGQESDQTVRETLEAWHATITSINRCVTLPAAHQALRVKFNKQGYRRGVRLETALVKRRPSGSTAEHRQASETDDNRGQPAANANPGDRLLGPNADRREHALRMPDSDRTPQSAVTTGMTTTVNTVTGRTIHLWFPRSSLLLREKYDETDQQLKRAHIIEHLELYLKTFFTFNGQVYEQKKATPMGSPLSGLNAEAVLQRLEQLVFSSYPPKFWARYVDDTLVVIKRSEVKAFKALLKSIFSDIQLTMEKEVNNQLPFLELLPAETRYSTFGRELLAIYLAVEHFRHFLECLDFTVFMYPKPLTFALRSHSDKYSPREIAHLDYISQFTTDIRHIDGTKNEVVDMLRKRRPITYL
ncbi:hypothetical protein SprV_0401713800 [Sparganum proliferum]